MNMNTFIFWMSGVLFTIGFIIDESHAFWEGFSLVVLSWFSWPFILGQHLSGKGWY